MRSGTIGRSACWSSPTSSSSAARWRSSRRARPATSREWAPRARARSVSASSSALISAVTGSGIVSIASTARCSGAGLSAGPALGGVGRRAGAALVSDASWRSAWSGWGAPTRPRGPTVGVGRPARGATAARYGRRGVAPEPCGRPRPGRRRARPRALAAPTRLRRSACRRSRRRRRLDQRRGRRGDGGNRRRRRTRRLRDRRDRGHLRLGGQRRDRRCGRHAERLERRRDRSDRVEGFRAGCGEEGEREQAAERGEHPSHHRRASAFS